MISSTKFQEIADRIVKRDKEFFDALLEFERTKKIRTKTRVNFTVDKVIAQEFKTYCRNKGYNMSAKIQQAMEEIIEKV